MNTHKYLKRIFIILSFCALTLVCNAQNLLDGTWYLHEVQIPSNEEFVDGIRYGIYECLIFSGENNEEAAEEWVDVDAFMEAFDESYEEAVALIEDESNEDAVASENESYEDVVALLYELEEGSNNTIYEIYNDSVLVINPSYGVYDVYVIKKLTKDVLVIATDRTMQGYTMYVYGKTKQPIKHSKHNIIYDNDLYPNPIVNRLSAKEIMSNSTPSAVAYNFVKAILESNPNKMLSYMDFETANAFETSRQANGYANYDPFFSEDGSKLNILGWKPFLSNNCEVAVLYVQSEWFDEKGRAVKKVYVGCAPSADVGKKGFQDITTFGDTNVKVLVVRNNEKWKVVGFK